MNYNIEYSVRRFLYDFITIRDETFIKDAIQHAFERVCLRVHSLSLGVLRTPPSVQDLFSSAIQRT